MRFARNIRPGVSSLNASRRFWLQLAQQLASGESTYASECLTGEPYSITRFSGGDICEAYRFSAAGASYFVKLHAAAPAGFFPAEAAGLEALRQTRLIRVPQVMGFGSYNDLDYLLLEDVTMRAANAASQTELGRGLAQLHRLPQDSFGGGLDNWIGTTPQPNPKCDDWVHFYREYRLRHQLQLAEDHGFGPELMPLAEPVVDRLEHWFEGYAPVPSLLHGDLWAGNQAVDETGAPVIFDPASYSGDRETDLAMTELFGGFAPAFYTAYEAEWPLDKGYARRRPLYQLYHVLNHLNLFGAGYLAQAQGLLQRLHRAL